MGETNIVETVTLLDQVAQTPLVWFWRVPYYFQVVGMLSIAAWILGLVALVKWFGRRRVGGALTFFFFATVSLGLWDLIDLPEFRWPIVVLRMGVVFLFVVLLWGDRRILHYRNILVIGLTALWLASVNSTHVSRIQPDRTKELEAARAKEEAARKEEVEERRQDRLSDIRFAEDTADDVHDLAGVVSKEKALEGKSAYQLFSEGKITEEEFRERLKAEAEEDGQTRDADAESGALEQVDAPAATEVADEMAAADEAASATGGVASAEEPTYRLRGKVEREAGRQETVKAFEQSLAQDVARVGRIMQEDDMFRAQKLDRLNLFLARGTFALVLLCLVSDYLRRFNRTGDSVLPMPIAGRLMDGLSAKTHAVLLPAEGRSLIKGYLRHAVLKGETFIYFGERDLWRRGALMRIHVLGLIDLLKAVVTTGHMLLERGMFRSRQAAHRYLAWETQHPAFAPPRRLVARTGLNATLALRQLGFRVLIAGVKLWGLLLSIVSAGIRSRYAACRRYPLASTPGAIMRCMVGAPLGRVAGLFQGLGRIVRRIVRVGTGLYGRVSAWLRMLREAGTERAEPTLPDLRKRMARGRKRARLVRWLNGLRYRVEQAYRFGRTWLDILIWHGWRKYLQKLTYDGKKVPPSYEFVLESAWFGRYCFCVTDPGLAGRLADELESFLGSRLVPRAAARRTVNIVWDRPVKPDRDELERLIFRCRESNLKLLMIQDGDAAPVDPDLFDEKLDVQTVAELSRAEAFHEEEDVEKRKHARWQAAVDAVEPVIRPLRRVWEGYLASLQIARETRQAAKARMVSVIQGLDGEDRGTEPYTG